MESIDLELKLNQFGGYIRREAALAGLPLKQSFAMTGSVNQHGEIQAIGGVNEKIEGFFDLCVATDLTGEQGVLIPQANVKHLMLRQDVIEAVKNKTIRHFFLVGGCDGAKPGRDYYTRFVEQVPDDCVVLTLACGKFRFFDKDMGDIGGIPRLLDIGQ